MANNENRLGRELGTLRRRLGLSQPDVADKLVERYGRAAPYTDSSSISRVERGRREPTRTDLLQLIIGGYGLNDVAEIDRLLALAEYSPAESGEVARYAQQNRAFTRDDSLTRAPLPQETMGQNPLPSTEFSRGTEGAILEVAKYFKLDSVSLIEEVRARSHDESRRRRLLQFREAALKIREAKLDNRLLKHYYPDSMLSAHGFDRYVLRINNLRAETNIVVKRDTIGLNIDLKTTSDRFSLRPPKFTAPVVREEEIADLIADSLLMDVKADNDPVFCLQQFSPISTETLMSFSLSSYFEFRLTYGALEQEMHRGLITTNFNSRDAFSRREEILTRRNRLLPDAAALDGYRSRICVGGVNVLFALKRQDDFVFFVGQRSSKVHTAPGIQCLIPTGFHQPLISAADEVSPARSVFRELWEEAYRGDEVISNDKHPKSDWYFKYPQLRWFREPSRRFFITIVGFGLNLKDGSFQLAVLLAVDDLNYWTQFGDDICGNYEYIHRGDRAISISTMDPNAIVALLTNPLCANSSCFSIVEALKRLKQIDPKRVKLPAIQCITAF